MVLETHQVIAVGAQIFLTQLHGGVGTASGARVDQAHRFHGAKAQGIASAPGDFFDRQARFEIRDVVGHVRIHGMRRHQLIDEVFVFRLVERTVQVVAGAVEGLVVAGRREGDGAVDGVSVDNRADAVVKKEAVRTRKAGEARRECVAGQGPCRDDGGL